MLAFSSKCLPDASVKALLFLFLPFLHDSKYHSCPGLRGPVHNGKRLVVHIWYKMCLDLILHGWLCAS